MDDKTKQAVDQLLKAADLLKNRGSKVEHIIGKDPIHEVNMLVGGALATLEEMPLINADVPDMDLKVGQLVYLAKEFYEYEPGSVWVCIVADKYSDNPSPYWSKNKYGTDELEFHINTARIRPPYSNKTTYHTPVKYGAFKPLTDEHIEALKKYCSRKITLPSGASASQAPATREASAHPNRLSIDLESVDMIEAFVGYIESHLVIEDKILKSLSDLDALFISNFRIEI